MKECACKEESVARQRFKACCWTVLAGVLVVALCAAIGGKAADKIGPAAILVMVAQLVRILGGFADEKKPSGAAVSTEARPLGNGAK